MGGGEPQDPLDQRTDDAVSACFDGEILQQDLVIFGAPEVILELASDEENAFVCVRLNEILDTGESLQISYRLLNLTHRNSHENIELLEPGKPCQITLALNDIAHTFAAGSRIRVAISNAFWPVVWPSPKPVTLSLKTARSRLTLPVRNPRQSDSDLRELAAPKQSRVQPQTILVQPRPMQAEFNSDLSSGVQTFRYATDTGKVRIEKSGWCFSCKTENRYRIHPDDPNSAEIESFATETYGREGNLDVRIEARQKMTSDEHYFYIEASIEAFENDASVFQKQWQESIARDGV
jgi:hypothetical protein